MQFFITFAVAAFTLPSISLGAYSAAHYAPSHHEASYHGAAPDYPLPKQPAPHREENHKHPIPEQPESHHDPDHKHSDPKQLAPHEEAPHKAASSHKPAYQTTIGHLTKPVQCHPSDHPSCKTNISKNGQCGSHNGATCLRSGFGNCCGPNNICGASVDDCGDGCDPRYGLCYDSDSLPYPGRVSSLAGNHDYPSSTEEYPSTSNPASDALAQQTGLSRSLTPASSYLSVTVTQSSLSGSIASQSSAPSSAMNPLVNGGRFIDWKTFKANGVNLGGWLEKERTHDPIWWEAVGGGDAPDEWTLCQTLGDQCGPIFEARYASFLNTSTIDKLASVGIDTLRIPTTYAAWISVPGSALYHGNQLSYLRTITQYAIDTYSMHIIIGLHSLPGGVNNLDIGEALLHDDWFYNATNLDYSFQAIAAILNFIQTSSSINAFTIGPINEASDNLAGFGSPAGLSTNATDWINTYIHGVLDQIAAVDKRIPLMLQDSFKGADYWAPFYDAATNMVIDSHVYYFAAAGAYANYIAPAICGQAQYIAQETKFPVFVGEWSLQTMYNNTLAGREALFNTQRYAWQRYVAGGSFWTAVSYSTTPVDGEGIQRDYWSYVDLIDQGVITTATDQAYC